jgi:hypothetical protein
MEGDRRKNPAERSLNFIDEIQTLYQHIVVVRSQEQSSTSSIQVISTAKKMATGNLRVIITGY